MEIDQRTSQQKQRTLEAIWKAKFHKVFVELSYNEMLKSYKSGTSYYKAGWKNVVATLRRKN